MGRESTDPTWLAIRGALAGMAACVAVVGTVWLVTAPTVDGLEEVALVVVDAHGVPEIAVVRRLDPLTWFGLPPATLYVLPPVALATAGLVAARLTRSSDSLIGVLAGLPIAFGYAPPLVLVAAMPVVDVATVAVVALAFALGFGALGGFVGVRT